MVKDVRLVRELCLHSDVCCSNQRTESLGCLRVCLFVCFFFCAFLLLMKFLVLVEVVFYGNRKLNSLK